MTLCAVRSLTSLHWTGPHTSACWLYLCTVIDLYSGKVVG